jgi:hypothetical protein
MKSRVGYILLSLLILWLIVSFWMTCTASAQVGFGAVATSYSTSLAAMVFGSLGGIVTKLLNIGGK